MKPILYTVPSFDAKVGTTVKFSWLGNVPMKNNVIIRKNSDNSIAYQSEQTTMRLEHTIAVPNSLVNGTLYNITVRVADSSNNYSEWSSPMLFYCYSTPSFGINISSGQVIMAQTYGVEVSYSQKEGELLQSYRVIVKSSNGEKIYDSNTRYSLSTIVISGLQDNNSYTIEATGVTEGSTKLTTGEIPFTADFVQADVYFICELENNYDKGSVYIKSNIVSVEGWSDWAVKYIDSNDVGDLTDGNRVHFDKDFSIDGNFLMAIKGYGYTANKTIASISSSKGKITLDYRVNGSVGYFELNVKQNNLQYVILSANVQHPISTTKTVWIKRFNNLYSLEVK